MGNATGTHATIQDKYADQRASQCRELGWCDPAECTSDNNEPEYNARHNTTINGIDVTTSFYDGHYGDIFMCPNYDSDNDTPADALEFAEELRSAAVIVQGMQVRHNLMRMKSEHHTTLGMFTAASGSLRLELVEREGQPSRVRIEPAGIELTQDQAGSFVYALRDAAYAAYREDTDSAAIDNYMEGEAL